MGNRDVWYLYITWSLWTSYACTCNGTIISSFHLYSYASVYTAGKVSEDLEVDIAPAKNIINNFWHQLCMPDADVFLLWFPKSFLTHFLVSTIDLHIPSPQRSTSSLLLSHKHGASTIITQFQWDISYLQHQSKGNNDFFWSLTFSTYL